MSLSTTTAFLTSKQIVLPDEIILYMAIFLKFEDYRSFIRSLWPNNEEKKIFKQKLWKMSTNKMTIEFLNGQQLEIEYNFDTSRKEDEHVLINFNSLLPVFGGIPPLVKNTFKNPPEMMNFVQMNILLNECLNYRYASCPCHLNLVPDIAAQFEQTSFDHTCESGHIHHYCSLHVEYWVAFLFDLLYMRLKEGESCDEEASEQYLRFLSDVIYFRGEVPGIRNSLL